MLKYILTTLIITVIMLVFQACDKIEAPYIRKTSSDPIGNVQKTVLVEEFTGHQCPNCPEGAVKLQQLLDTYGSRVIAVSIHAGFFARTNPTGYFTTDYRTPAGTEIDNFFNISASGLPAGMVSRRGYNTAHRLLPAAFASAVEEALQLAPETDININKTYTPANRTISMTVNVKTVQQLAKKLMLSVMILEDSLISPQKNSNPMYGPDPIVNFVHRHVLRAAVNGTWGDQLSDGSQPLPSGTALSRNYQYVLNPAWNASCIHIVAFVYDGNTYEVLQAASSHL